MRRSSTDSRLSQRTVASLYSIDKDMDIETWDTSTAFLQGLNNKDLEKSADQLRDQTGIRNYEKPNIHISDNES
eukprot:3339501-Pyramimonas_sp.AAC.1